MPSGQNQHDGCVRLKTRICDACVPKLQIAALYCAESLRWFFDRVIDYQQVSAFACERSACADRAIVSASGQGEAIGSSAVGTDLGVGKYASVHRAGDVVSDLAAELKRQLGAVGSRDHRLLRELTQKPGGEG